MPGAEEGTTAMSSTEFAAPRVDGFVLSVGRKLRSAIRTIQYARMLQVMSELSDTQLESLGLTRTAIPAYAQRCIYGAED